VCGRGEEEEEEERGEERAKSVKQNLSEERERETGSNKEGCIIYLAPRFLYASKHIWKFRVLQGRHRLIATLSSVTVLLGVAS
jgi:hypothetical protein